MGERELIARIRERLSVDALDSGPSVVVASGDDAAVTVPSAATATSVDALVEGVHFRRETAPLRSIGRKALAAALSDLAAMGADPGEAYVVLGIPPDLDEQGCMEVCDGLATGAAEWGTALLGGDVTRAPVLALAVTVVGHAPSPERLVRRGGGSPGDVVAVTGRLGGAAAGLRLIERPELGAAIPSAERDALRRRHLDPVPRLGPGRALAGAGATAMIDISDGLGRDAASLAAASGARMRIELDRLPVDGGVADLAASAGIDPLDLAAAGGEDYELLAALPAGALAEAAAAVEAAGSPLTEIGSMLDGSGVELRGPTGAIRTPEGFDHLDEWPAAGERYG